MRAWEIAKRTLLELIRDKRTLALIILVPVLVLSLLKIVFNTSDNTKVSIATVGMEQKMRDDLNDVKNISVEKLTSATRAKKELKDNKVDAVIDAKSNNKYDVTYANTDPSKTQMTKAALQKASIENSVYQMKGTVVELKGALQKMQAGLQKQQAAMTDLEKALPANVQQELAKKQQGKSAVAPTFKQPAKQQKVKITNHYNYGDSSTNYFDKMVPILMGFFVFFLVFLISGMALLKERTSGTLGRLLATPVKRSDIVFGYMISYGIIAVVQTLIIVFVTIWLLNVEIVGSIWLVILTNIVLALVALAFGILMSTFAASEFQMMQFIPVIIIPQLLFSGIIPLDQMASWVQKIGYFLPLKYAGDSLTNVIMNNANISMIAGNLGVLLLFLIVLTVLNITGLRRYRKV